MKVYKLKDSIAILWFIVIALLQYKKYYRMVMILLLFGAVGDLIISVTNIGDTIIDSLI